MHQHDEQHSLGECRHYNEGGAWRRFRRLVLGRLVGRESEWKEPLGSSSSRSELVAGGAAY